MACGSGGSFVGSGRAANRRDFDPGADRERAFACYRISSCRKPPGTRAGANPKTDIGPLQTGQRGTGIVVRCSLGSLSRVTIATRATVMSHGSASSTLPLLWFRKPFVARFGRIDRSVELPPCARRCRRTDARNATVGSDNGATSSAAAETNRPLAADLDAQADRVRGGAAKIQGEAAVTLPSRSGDSGRTLAAG
jgi:hypothetical protein